MKLILTCLSTTCVTITNVTSNAQKHRKIPVFFPSCFAVPTFPGSSRCKILVDNCLQFLCRCMKTCCLPLGVRKKKMPDDCVSHSHSQSSGPEKQTSSNHTHLASTSFFIVMICWHHLHYWPDPIKAPTLTNLLVFSTALFLGRL